jgi:hypothetical protein
MNFNFRRPPQALDQLTKALANCPREVTVNHGPINITSNVTEKRAPTDESVRILNEMQAAAINSLLAKWEISDNIINCRAAMFRRPEHMDTLIVVVYRFNHIEDRRVEYSFDPTKVQLGTMTVANIVDGIKQAVAKDVAEVLTRSALQVIGQDLLQQKYQM